MTGESLPTSSGSRKRTACSAAILRRFLRKFLIYLPIIMWWSPGHQADEQCVRQILRRKYAYVGMIGSKNKVAKTKEALYKSGFRPAEVEAIHAPIGLKIGAVTPEEIAVCIAAEIIQEKNKVPVETIEDAVLDALCEDTGSTMALIVAKAVLLPEKQGQEW